MRLTNIAQLRLPPGTVHSYSVRVERRASRPLPVSFDQARHVGAGDRPGSWMAISFRVRNATREQVAAAWDAVVARHGTLRTVFSPPDRAAGTVQLHEGDASPGSWTPHPIVDSPARTVRAVFDASCRPFGEPSHGLCLIEPHGGADPRPIVVIGADHAHLDMWSLVVLARDLAIALDGAAPPAPVDDFAAHTAELERMPPAPAEVHEAWQRALEDGGGLMPRFPLPLGDVSRQHPEVVEVRDVLDAGGMLRLGRRADAHGVRVTAFALSVLAGVSLDLAGTPLRAVFPVHSRYDRRWHDSVGWYITNSVIECADPTPAGCAAAVRRALILGSHPLTPILAPWGGMPPTPGMFAISWLDLRRLPVAPPEGSDPHWVSAVTETDGVMIWFVVDDSGMHLRCRYPDTPEARRSVSTWLDAVEEGLRAVASR